MDLILLITLWEFNANSRVMERVKDGGRGRLVSI